MPLDRLLAALVRRQLVKVARVVGRGLEASARLVSNSGSNCLSASFSGSTVLSSSLPVARIGAEDARVAAAEVVQEVALEPADVLDRDVVELAGGAGPDRDDLLLDRERRVLGLLEQLDQPCTTLELGLRCRVQVGAERGERLQLAVLGQVQAQPAGDLLHRLDLRRAADPGDRDADVDGRPDARS